MFGFQKGYVQKSQKLWLPFGGEVDRIKGRCIGWLGTNCARRSQGVGLGFKDMSSFNLDLEAKQG